MQPACATRLLAVACLLVALLAAAQGQFTPQIGSSGYTEDLVPLNATEKGTIADIVEVHQCVALRSLLMPVSLPARPSRLEHVSPRPS